MNPDRYQNPYSNYPSIRPNVRAQSPAAIMRRLHPVKSNDQKHDAIALQIAILEEKTERILGKCK